MLTQEQKATNYETMVHIDQVRILLTSAINELLQRMIDHDQSKLTSPEVEIFTEFTPKLKNIQYGSEEYKQCLQQMSSALDNHYKMNRHHPEHFSNGIQDMNLLDILEMTCDWIASTKRTKNGDIYNSLNIQKERFDISPQLLQIIKNTVDWLTSPKT